MYASEVLNQQSDVLTWQSALYAMSLNIDELFQEYQRINIKLEVIADEVPSDDFNVDAMISRERTLHAAKQDVLQSLKSASVKSESDISLIAQILKNESVLNGHVLQSVFVDDPTLDLMDK